MKKVLFTWSGGKDSALALHELKQKNDIGIVSLLTTISEEYDRTSMHGIRSELLDKQAEVLGVPLVKVSIPLGGGM